MKVFGDHEPNVIQQLENCVAAEEGALGVLCADGHLGYSQPIGGAVAYRQHVSPSGVVLAAHEGTVRIIHRLRPIGVAMAAADVVDPFKD